MNRLLALLILATVYLLTLASVKPLDVVTALVLAGALLIGLNRFLARPASEGGPPLLRRLLHAPAFALAVIVEITVGTWRVVLLVLGIRKLTHPGIVLIPIGDRSETGVVVTALSITLSPGEVLVDIDWERRAMLVHVIDASDADAVRAHYQHFYDRFQKPVLP